jgi:Asp/Glu/hydantoin racemase
MTQLVVFVHTVPPLIALFDQLGSEMLPQVQRSHILDEPLLMAVRQRGKINRQHSLRLLSHLRLAQQTGAAAALVTCSTLSPAVDQVSGAVRMPVLGIDGPMVEQAVLCGRRIGIVATAQETLIATEQRLRDQAQLSAHQIELQSEFVPSALQALLGGDGGTHDRLVKAAVARMMARVDAVVLAQASMARVLEVLPESERLVPVLSSPRLAMERLRSLLFPQTAD